MELIKKGTVIAAVKSENFDSAVASEAQWIIDLSPDLNTLSEKVEAAHNAGKKLLIHFDLATGIGKDRSGMLYAKNAGVDGIISTRVNIIKLARQADIFTVQRFFIVDSHSIDTTIEALSASKADMIEIMPGIIPKIIKSLAAEINTPIIAGGLIETEAEMSSVLEAGATAISTGNKELWKK
ncbi:MAG: glycerol-3-phosphate responsive antiterminator [Clostridia bacterium]|nr:glycerol-3-phosphate responsive antiterminator [Clostridia bacterium]